MPAAAEPRRRAGLLLHGGLAGAGAKPQRIPLAT